MPFADFDDEHDKMLDSNIPCLSNDIVLHDPFVWRDRQLRVLLKLQAPFHQPHCHLRVTTVTLLGLSAMIFLDIGVTLLIDRFEVPNQSNRSILTKRELNSA